VYSLVLLAPRIPALLPASWPWKLSLLAALEPGIPPGTFSWPYLAILERLALALALGLFTGFERERRGKEAGLRTFGFAALLGGVGGLLGTPFALLGLSFVCLLVILLNLQSLLASGSVELTTSVALLVTGFVGVLAGLGHTLTPTALAIVTAGLLASKRRLVWLTDVLTEEEVRAGILLAVLAFVVYPALPPGKVDPWHLIDAQEAWVTVILIAAIGVVNYALLKLLGQRGMLLAGFLGALANSKVAIAEIARSSHELKGVLSRVTYITLNFTTAAVVIRNTGLLLVLAPEAAVATAASSGLMLLASLAPGLRLLKPSDDGGPSDRPIPLSSPLSLISVLRFGLLFLALQVAGALAQRQFGSGGFFIVCVLGGFVSSASAVASAATLNRAHTITTAVAGTGVLLTTAVSILVNLILYSRVARDWPMTKRYGAMTAIVIVLGVLGAAGQHFLLG